MTSDPAPKVNGPSLIVSLSNGKRTVGSLSTEELREVVDTHLRGMAGQGDHKAIFADFLLRELARREDQAERERLSAQADQQSKDSKAIAKMSIWVAVIATIATAGQLVVQYLQYTNAPGH